MVPDADLTAANVGLMVPGTDVTAVNVGLNNNNKQGLIR